MKNIAIIGAGAVGGYFGGRLCQLQNADCDIRVSFVARGEHLRMIQQEGLSLGGELGELVCRPFLATDRIPELPTPDLCLVCVKVYDLPEALRALQPLIRDRTIVLPLLNGVDVSRRIRSIIKTGVVLPACVYIGTHIERPGRVVQRGGNCTILFGGDPDRPEFSLADLTMTFARAGIDAKPAADIELEIWKKFVFIGGFGLVAAARGKTMGQILECESLRQETRSIMDEIIAVAQKSGVPLPSDLADSSLARALEFPPSTKTSFQRDFENRRRPDERDLFAGTMLRMAEEFGVEVPVTRTIAALLDELKPAGAFA